jgi:hypothetical protein
MTNDLDPDRVSADAHLPNLLSNLDDLAQSKCNSWRVRRAMRERQAALAEVIHAIREFKKASEHPLEQINYRFPPDRLTGRRDSVMIRQLGGAAVGLFVFFAFLGLEALWAHFANTPRQIPQPNPDLQRQIFSSSLDLVKMLFTLNSALLAGFGVLVMKLCETVQFSLNGIRLISVTFGCLAAGMWFAYDSYATTLQLYAKTGLTNVITGSFDVTSTLQILALLLGATCYAILLFTIIQRPKTQSDARC